jgi:hypothetical protein
MDTLDTFRVSRDTVPSFRCPYVDHVWAETKTPTRTVSIGVREVVTKAAKVGSLCLDNACSQRFVPADAC